MFDKSAGQKKPPLFAELDVIAENIIEVEGLKRKDPHVIAYAWHRLAEIVRYALEKAEETNSKDTRSFLELHNAILTIAERLTNYPENRSLSNMPEQSTKFMRERSSKIIAKVYDFLDTLLLDQSEIPANTVILSKKPLAKFYGDMSPVASYMSMLDGKNPEPRNCEFYSQYEFYPQYGYYPQSEEQQETAQALNLQANIL
ncbi:MAG: hypothetical protein WBK55_01540 [Alphaproteobacteria bacterium]